MVDYTTYVADLDNMIAMDATDTTFQEIIPAIINYAEMRIYRELDLISTIFRDTSVSLTTANPNATLPSTFVTVQGINVLTPIATDPRTAVRNPLVPTSKEVIYALWGNPNSTGLPTMYAMVDQWKLILGPSPDNFYTLEAYGTQRPAPLSASNTTTFLTTYLYDLFIAASMVFVSGYMRNFSSSGSDPQMPINWEQQYQALKGSAAIEELRKKSWSDSWTAFSPTPLAQPPRG
ncbi:phage adaptor protein [Rhizobium lusitanum]|uniref:Uncharacterized protein n=1 Tax=Rhizobium lusitanum TaxID=293958 RepID=A0A1C3VRF2_9HYPH|nr:hypothetical protein [Rhizobium lusitanum]SCB30278.1 hypothetical protein GA0061101_10685 [Rhizobium lusitanum]